MALSKEQRKSLAGIRKLIKSTAWVDVRQGLVLISAADDPALWAVLAEGVRFSAEGRLLLGEGEIKKRVKKVHRVGVALAVARQVGLLESMTTLDLSGSGIEDLQPLRGLVNLTALNLSECPAVQDLRPLAGLSSVETLELSFNQGSGRWNAILTSLDGLEGLVSLTTLDIRGCKALQDIQALKGLVRLTALNLINCQSLSDLSGLEGLSSLQELNLNGCTAVTRLQALSGLTTLTTLDLSRCAMSALRSLSALSGLRSLRIYSGKHLSDLSGLEGLSSLKGLQLRLCERVTDLQPLSGLTSLSTLDLQDCRALVDLSGLEGLVSLTSLDLYECVALQDLQPLKALKGLTLRFGHPGMGDLSPLKALTNLTTLHLNHGTSWSWHFANSALSDLSPLKALTSLTLLTLGYCKRLSDGEINALREALPDCEILRRRTFSVFDRHTDPQLRELGVPLERLLLVRAACTDRRIAALEDTLSAATFEALMYLHAGLEYSEVVAFHQASAAQ